MPRQMRREFAGAIYHVMNRGDRREEIFRTERDRRVQHQRRRDRGLELYHRSLATDLEQNNANIRLDPFAVPL